MLTYFAVRISGKPADAEHQYGHGKVESVTALAETALLFLLSGVVIFEAVQRLLGAHAHAVEASAAAFVVIAVSIVVDFFRARTLKRVAKATSSEALEADALHFGSDMWSSIAVLIGLGGVALGYPWADAAAAIVVAVFICIAGWRLGRRTIDTLTDTAPAGVSERVAAIARQVPGVVAVERVRARPAGAVLFVELGVGVSRTLPLDRVTAIKERLDARHPRRHAQCRSHDHHRAARARRRDGARTGDGDRARPRPCHSSRRRAGDFRAGCRSRPISKSRARSRSPPRMRSRAGSKRPCATNLAPDVEVETHIEPLAGRRTAGRDAAPARIAEVREALAALAAEFPGLGEVHDVRVRETADGEIVNFHCRVDPALSVSAVHDMVDALERRLRRRFPTIQRVIGHAEPRR